MEAAALGFCEASFDAALMFGNNLGIAGTLDATERMFAQLRSIVKRLGLLIRESRDPLATDSAGHVAFHAANREGGRPPGQVRLWMECEGAVGEWFHLVFLEPDRLQALPEGTGWAVAGLHRTPDWGGYTIVARRPGV